ncbi:hypothetical protein [Vulgatibacter incomptus]|uniref:Uncharacterized protein n=1 Tax=Vulgatibacter incomptus TaxID=1391653 RepID=A0A0K1PE47_9BACT|nr:hypothetical protein [Vulgatibacter incomptus]AKU91399.1 hypothetical protein AKJ08_1786 [Vulgatibacter incomptus]
MSGHPSFLVLDRLALGEDLPEVRRHVGACTSCSAHLARVDPGELPHLPDLRDRLRRQNMVTVLPATRRPRLWAGIAGPALAAGVALGWFGHARVAEPPADETPGWIAAKGAPSVAIYVKRGERVRLWDGATALQPGDRLRVRITPESYTHALLAMWDPASGSWTPLFEGEVPGSGPFFVPGTWELDPAPGAERLAIALDRGPVGLDRAAWRTELAIPKAGR